MVLKIMILQNLTEEPSKLSQTSKMEHFTKIVQGWKPLTIFTTSFILDVLLGPEFAFALLWFHEP